MLVRQAQVQQCRVPKSTELALFRDVLWWRIWAIAHKGQETCRATGVAVAGEWACVKRKDTG